MNRTYSPRETVLKSYQVEAVEAGDKANSVAMRCAIGGDLKFDVSPLFIYFGKDWDSLVFDALLLASAVEFCDFTCKRSPSYWSRSIDLSVPVHNPDHWNSKSVLGDLRRTLNLLTGDSWNFTFKPRINRQPALREPHLGSMYDVDAVIPFSDGLDSWVTAGIEARKLGRKLVRVRLGKVTERESPPNNDRSPFISVPFGFHTSDLRRKEYSLRTRGFKFALVGGITAYLSKAGKVIIPESGQGTLGPVLLPNGAAGPDFRNHPRFTNYMTSLMYNLFDYELVYEHPRIWSTKAETIREFLSIQPVDCAWNRTRSCWQNQRHVSRDGRKVQCGVCAACMLRRMSLFQINVSEHVGTYAWENLQATEFEDGRAEGSNVRNPQGVFYRYAIAGTYCLAQFAGYKHEQNISNLHVSQLSKCLSTDEQDTRNKLERLLKQHRREWQDFLEFLGEDSFITQWAKTS